MSEPTIFQYEDGQWMSAQFLGGSAGLNSAMFFVCPICGACVVDMDYTTTNRVLHDKSHRSTSPQMELKDTTTIFDWNGNTSIHEAIGNAIGLASLCWSIPPEGIFDDARASKIVSELTSFIGSKVMGEI